MHDQAYSWVAQNATTWPAAVLDIGGRNINGSVKQLFPAADPYLSLDLYPGPGVDIVADATTWTPDRGYNVVVCAEVFEHTPHWREILATAYRALVPGGLLIATMAGPGRQVHSGIDGGPTLHPAEHYANVAPADLAIALHTGGWRDIVVDQRHDPADVRAVARR